ncbi:hypothetical protein [endosymbiont GvMRE of Glomus versiforme]|uniref:hypothetical protein n=1 Tax=endosymbiont GvMRE of Glomus versiforme TaxID=2039283 RepID=UPI000ED6BFE3|nr:hypothetical protein [endosymbiont GvMRE of Glomus versiforme]RHZ35392.1 hypothetical protein GvMRE_IIg167 [endosymbiont GvMRE of Glomus versiforme]
MNHFKYNYLNNLLWKVKGECSYSIDNPQSQFTTEYGAKGFILVPDNHWITFTIYPDKVKAFYKCVKENQIIYYQKIMPIVPLNQLPLVVPQKYREIEFIFTEKNEVIKENGQWIYKSHAD